MRLPASSEACRFLSTDDIVSFSLVARLCVAGGEGTLASGNGTDHPAARKKR